MKNRTPWKTAIGASAITAALALSACKSDKVADNSPLDLGEPERSVEVLVTENPNKNLPMDFAVASETARESQTFPGAFRIAADHIEIGRASSGTIPNIGANGEAYLEMPHPDGTPLHIRGSRIRSHNGTVTISGWPVVVRDGKRLVGTTKDTVIKVGSSGVQALGPSVVEDLISSGSSIDDLLTPEPSLSLSEPFIPLPPEPEPTKEEVALNPIASASEAPKKRGIIDGKPVGKKPKRGFTGGYEGTENPILPGAPPSSIDLTPGTVSSDLGIGNIPPLPTVPNE